MTFDPIQAVYGILIVLLLVGVIPFTHVAVSLILLVGAVEFKISVRR